MIAYTQFSCLQTLSKHRKLTEKSRLHTVLQTSVLVKRTVKKFIYLFCVSVLETGCPNATQVGLEFIILLPRSPDCKDLRHALLT